MGPHVKWINGLAVQVMVQFSKGIGWTEGKKVEAQAAGTLVLSCLSDQAGLCWVSVCNLNETNTNKEPA